MCESGSGGSGGGRWNARSAGKVKAETKTEARDAARLEQETKRKSRVAGDPRTGRGPGDQAREPH